MAAGRVGQQGRRARERNNRNVQAPSPKATGIGFSGAASVGGDLAGSRQLAVETCASRVVGRDGRVASAEEVSAPSQASVF